MLNLLLEQLCIYHFNNDKVLKMSLQVQNWNINGMKNVAVYAFSSGKFLDVMKYACVKDLTNIMPGFFEVISAQRQLNRRLRGCCRKFGSK